MTVSVSAAALNVTVPWPVPVLGDSPSPVKVAVAMKSLRAEPWTASRTTRANQALRVFMALTSRDAWRRLCSAVLDRARARSAAYPAVDTAH